MVAFNIRKNNIGGDFLIAGKAETNDSPLLLLTSPLEKCNTLKLIRKITSKTDETHLLITLLMNKYRENEWTKITPFLFHTSIGRNESSVLLKTRLQAPAAPF
jgi:hypothetical protein